MWKIKNVKNCSASLNVSPVKPVVKIDLRAERREFIAYFVD